MKKRISRRKPAPRPTVADMVRILNATNDRMFDGHDKPVTPTAKNSYNDNTENLAALGSFAEQEVNRLHNILWRLNNSETELTEIELREKTNAEARLATMEGVAAQTGMPIAESFGFRLKQATDAREEKRAAVPADQRIYPVTPNATAHHNTPIIQNGRKVIITKFLGGGAYLTKAARYHGVMLDGQVKHRDNGFALPQFDLPDNETSRKLVKLVKRLKNRESYTLLPTQSVIMGIISAEPEPDKVDYFADTTHRVLSAKVSHNNRGLIKERKVRVIKKPCAEYAGIHVIEVTRLVQDEVKPLEPIKARPAVTRPIKESERAHARMAREIQQKEQRINHYAR